MCVHCLGRMRMCIPRWQDECGRVHIRRKDVHAPIGKEARTHPGAFRLKCIPSSPPPPPHPPPPPVPHPPVPHPPPPQLPPLRASIDGQATSAPPPPPPPTAACCCTRCRPLPPPRSRSRSLDMVRDTDAGEALHSTSSSTASSIDWRAVITSSPRPPLPPPPDMPRTRVDDAWSMSLP